MSNKGRVLTLVVKITDEEAAKWIWDAHTKGALNGVIVKSMHEGDVVPFEDYEDDDDEIEEEEFY